MSDQPPKKPGKGARPTTFPRRVQAAMDDLYPYADGVLIIACKAGTGSDMGETVVMRWAGSGLLLEGAIMRLTEGGELFPGMTLDAESEVGGAEDDGDE